MVNATAIRRGLELYECIPDDLINDIMPSSRCHEVAAIASTSLPVKQEAARKTNGIVSSSTGRLPKDGQTRYKQVSSEHVGVDINQLDGR